MDTLDTVIEGGGRTEPGPSYFEALTAFLDRLNAAEVEHYARNYPNIDPTTYVVSGRGRKYDKISRIHKTELAGGVFCFVEKETGLVWKPANARAPVRNFPRGDIFALPERPAKAKEDPIRLIPAARW